MDEEIAKITRIIRASNFYFQIELDDEEVIQRCLKEPGSHGSKALSKKLKDLLSKIPNASNMERNRQFWKTIRTVTENAIDHLSGKKKEVPEQKLVVPRTLKRSSSFFDVRQVLKAAELQCFVPFWFAAPELYSQSTFKLAEGSFGEVYQIVKPDESERILKIIPVGGHSPKDDVPNLSFKEIIGEVTTSLELAKLERGVHNRCSAFPNIYRVCVVQDSVPRTVVNAWKDYENINESLHPRPDAYDSTQAFITIETEIGGIEIQDFRPLDFLEAESIIKQVASAVAIAEEEMEFEHRDLHVGNILIKECDEEEINVIFRNRTFRIQTHGIRAMIIDFTFSRISTDDGVQYLELDDIYDIERNSRDGYLDHRFVYSKMEEQTRRKWGEYHPRTNILWMKHITESLLSMENLSMDISREEEIAMMALRIHNRTCLAYESVADFARECILF